MLVGTTGTGKTSTLNIYTGNDLTVGEGAQSVTSTTVSVEDKIHEGGPRWIDNPGASRVCSIIISTIISRVVRLRGQV